MWMVVGLEKHGPTDDRTPEPVVADGPSRSQLTAIGWFLALISLGSWVYFIADIGKLRSWDSKTGLALALAVTSTIFSATCTVVVALKSVEAKLLRAQATNRGELQS